MEKTKEEIINIALQSKLISALKIDDLWVQFLESFASELSLFQEDFAETKDYFNIYSQLEDGLLDISNTFGYIPNLIIDNSLGLVRKEVQSIPTRIRNKTTYDGYYIILKQINRIGEVYNYYWSGLKLIKAIKMEEIVKNLNNLINYNSPFLGISADKNFSVINSIAPIHLDEGYVLDDKKGNFYWQLDENIQISPTKHLGVEYYTRDLVKDKNNKEYLLTSDFFRYLDTGVDYNKRIPIIPHGGIQLGVVVSESGSYNFFDNKLDYSIPQLKIKVCSAYEYTKRFISLENFNLDGSLGLDELITWKLDTEKNTLNRIPLSSFKYISCGSGKININDEKNKNIFPYDKIALFYTFGDKDNLNTIRDYSSNNISTKINEGGSTKKVEGIIAKTVNFDGNTYVYSESEITLVASNISLGFWLNPNKEDIYKVEDTLTILDFDFLKVTYNYGSEDLTIVTDSIVTHTYKISKNTINNLIFEFHSDTDKLSIYKNGEELDIFSISTYSGDFNLGIGADYNGENKFIGIIDSFWLLAKHFTKEEKDYIYNNRIGIITQLANRMAYYEIDNIHETYEDDRWYIIQSYIKAHDVFGDFAFKVDKDIDTYTGNTKFFPILPKYFTFDYTEKQGDIIKTQTIKANEKGELYNINTNENISGNINFATGEYNLYTSTKKYITQEVISNPNGDKKTYSSILNNNDDNFTSFEKESLIIKYRLGEYDYIAKDNGEGVITGVEALGTINYITGEVDINFNIEVTNDVLAFYTYNRNLNMMEDSDIFMSYKLDKGEITEIGLEDENHNLLTYMTLPPIQFDNFNNHASIFTAIRKS